ncbi:MAG: hypothetical protein MUC52_03060 [Candidatus Omnitrophica bacterium]|nr:hypothetical protein [Candidatus Omnitrophota bacterium]
MARIIGRSGAGFTLIEAVMVIVIAGLLVAVSIPRLQSFNTAKLNGAAKKIVSDIRFTQQLSVSTHDTYRISFNTASDSYDIRRVSDSAFAKDPFSRGDFSINLQTDPKYAGTDITSALFNSTQGLQFTWQGTPQNSNGADLTANGTVALSYKGAGMTISVRPYTGSVQVR